MKILLATEWYPPDIGGVSSHVTSLEKYLRKREHNVYIVTRRKNRKEKPSIIELSTKNILEGFFSNGDVKEVFKEVDPDIVHAHHAFTPVPLLSIKVSSELGYPLVLTNHSAYFYDYEAVLRILALFSIPVRSILSKTNKIIAVSETAKKFIEKIVPGVPVTVVPNGVDTEIFTPYGSKDLKEELEDSFIILYVGRLVPRKGIRILLDSMPYILKKIPEAKLVIVGEGILLNELKERAKVLEIEEHVIFRGGVSQNNLPDIYRSSDIVVIPSIYGESFGIVAIEAMACGKPVIASPVGGLQEIIIDGINGLLLKSVNITEIVEKIYYLYVNKELYKEISLNALKIVYEKYSWDKLISEIEKIYKTVIK